MILYGFSTALSRGLAGSTTARQSVQAMSDSLTFRLLKYIKESAETLNFTRAAERVFVAQSSVSHQIGKLEENIDLVIFDRLQNGLKLTAAGRLIAAYAETTLRDWEQTLAMAHAVQRHQVPPLRLGFSSFVNAKILEKFHEHYEDMFAGCALQLVSGDTVLCLQRLDAGLLDCAILPLPIDANFYSIQPISQSPLVVCMRADDALAERAQLDIREVAARIKVFRDSEQYPAAHARLVEMFTEAGVALHVGCSARTPAEIQWMVKERYGLALIDQLLPLEPGLITRPLAGLTWTADTAFIHLRKAGHVALPFIERFFEDSWSESRGRKQPSKSDRPEQLELLA
jgi:DNA-binding transcriptional LysR family regulator